MADLPDAAVNRDHALNRAAVVNDMRSDQIGSQETVTELLSYLPEMGRRMEWRDVDHVANQRVLRATLAAHGREGEARQHGQRVALSPDESRTMASNFGAWLDGFAICLRILHNIKEEAESANRT